MKRMSFMLLTLTILSGGPALAHKPGFYEIDKNTDARVLFQVFGKCPKVKGALQGKLRTFTFSELATSSRYKYISGFYVETHPSKGKEVYIMTDYNCIPLKEEVGLVATKKSLGDFSIQRAAKQ